MVPAPRILVLGDDFKYISVKDHVGVREAYEHFAHEFLDISWESGRRPEEVPLIFPIVIC